MPDLSELYAGKYYKAADVENKPFKATISRVGIEKMQGDGRSKAVLYFEGRDRGVVLNGSRHDAVCQIAKSNNSDDWVGCEVVVCAGTTNYAGKRVGCVEIKPPARKVSPEQQKAEVREALNDRIDDLPDFTL